MNASLYKINYFAEIHSTNLYAMENLAALANRTVIVADIQTSGRGQFNRKWVSDKPGNVYMSVVLKDLPLVNLTGSMAEAVCSALNSYGISPEIKEPNDVLVRGRKIAGILSQSSTRGDKLNGIVVGVGVNLNMDIVDIERIDQPATSLNLLLNKPVNRDEFIEKLLDEFFENRYVKQALQ